MSITLDTRERILDQARELVQTRGYDGFSFADVADRVGIRKASIHHHFPSKGDLGVELIERFRRDCRARLAGIGPDLGPVRRIEGYCGLFRETLAAGRMCLCGILAAGFTNLPEGVRVSLVDALSEQEAWAAGVILDGQNAGVFRAEASPEDLGRSLVGCLEGAILIARVHADPGRFEAAVRWQIDGLLAAPLSASRRPAD